MDGSLRATIRLVPQGPLMDGSTGRTIVREITNSASSRGRVIRDVPLGAYTVSATRSAANGTETPLQVIARSVNGASGPAPAPAAQARLVFEPSGSSEPEVLGSNGVHPMNLAVMPGSGAVPATRPDPAPAAPTAPPASPVPAHPATPQPAARPTEYRVGDRVEHYNWMDGSWTPGVVKSIREGYLGARIYVLETAGGDVHSDIDKMRPAPPR
ncbi:MAG: hypothetical protein KY467_08710 [Gemmatimonadetes bacterium]|nr:hypothetical protein [Gemmatimonadota bacterium]